MAIRKQRHGNPGTQLTGENREDSVLLKAPPLFPATTIGDVFGLLAFGAAPLSLEQMDAAVAAEAKPPRPTPTPAL